MDQGRYSQPYEGYGEYMSQQGYYNAPSISPCTIQAPPPNNYFQDPYPLQPYQDSPCYSQLPYHSPYPQQYQNPQYASYDQYSQYLQYYTPPQHSFPPQDYSLNPYPSSFHYTPYPQDTQHPNENHTHSPSVGSYGIDEDTLALARRWGVTIVPDDGYPMRPSGEEYVNNQWEPQEPFYHDPQQECQSFDQDPDMQSMMDNMKASMLMQMNELQAKFDSFLDNMKAQMQGLTTHESIQSSFPYEEVIHELFTPSEGGDEEESEDKGDDDEEVDEEIEMETLNWEEGVELNENGGEEKIDNWGKEQLQNVPIKEEVLKENEVDRVNELNGEIPLKDENFLDENFLQILKSGGVCFENIDPQWYIFTSKDSYFLLVHEEDPRISLLGDLEIGKSQIYYQEPMFRKKSLVDLWVKNGFEEGICWTFYFDKLQNFCFKMVNLGCKEFIDGHHLRLYLEEKVDRKHGMFILQSNDG